MDWKYEYLVDQIHRTSYKKHENFVVGSLLHDNELSDLMPRTQHYVDKIDNGYALIDLFYPQINLAIEIDEPAHESNYLHDNNRQRIIENELNCNFFRIKVQQGKVISQINELKKIIKKLRTETKRSGKWKSWEKPERLSLYDVKNLMNNTLFLKIKGEIHPNELLVRQTGYWRIDKRKQNKIKTVIVVHDSYVTKIFGEINWYAWKDNPKKVGYKGKEKGSEIKIGTIIDDWNFQQTVTYSNDLY